MSIVGKTKSNITVVTLQQKKDKGQKISALTAYDYPTAKLVDQSGIDLILVGDSVGMAVLGYDTTLPVTMKEMIHHCKSVARGVQNALLVGDMPFLSYQVSPRDAVKNAGKFLQQGGMDAVKLEGGRERLETVRRIVDAGIPVMGHLGLTPQSVNQLGGFRAQGKTLIDAKKIYEDALLLEEAGIFSLVLESVPVQLAADITKALTVPTIGIGSGPECDGQILVLHDMVGMTDMQAPRFVKKYADVNSVILSALQAYIADVENARFPEPANSFQMDDDIYTEFSSLIIDSK